MERENATIISPLDFDAQALIIANGEMPAPDMLAYWAVRTGYTVCCDGAADKAAARGIVPDAIVGDGDSLSLESREAFAPKLHLESEQETNDLTKAVRFLKARGCTRVVILGATGGREDHTLGNISLLLHYLRHGVTALMPTSHGVFIPCEGNVGIETEEGQEVSLFNCNATGLKAEGLEYKCYDFDRIWQGTLNRATSGRIKIQAEGCYIVFLANPGE